MKILVMGAGAIGGCYGGLLARAGEDVTFLARGDNLRAIRERGLRVESATHGDFTARPKAVERLDGAWQADLILFCVKGYHNARAMDDMAAAVGARTAILTLQNGIGSGEQLGERFGAGKVLLGAAYIDAMRKAPGVAAQRGSAPRIVFGEASGVVSERGRAIERALRGAGIEAELSADIMTALWGKLIYICALSGMMCVTRASFADVLDTPETRGLALEVMREAQAVGLASGAALDEGIVDRVMAGFEEEKGDLLSSMFLDLEAGRPLEVGLINGAVARIGREVGVATPANSFIAACLAIADNKARGMQA